VCVLDAGWVLGANLEHRYPRRCALGGTVRARARCSASCGRRPRWALEVQQQTRKGAAVDRAGQRSWQPLHLWPMMLGAPTIPIARPVRCANIALADVYVKLRRRWPLSWRCRRIACDF